MTTTVKTTFVRAVHALLAVAMVAGVAAHGQTAAPAPQPQAAAPASQPVLIVTGKNATGLYHRRTCAWLKNVGADALMPLSLAAAEKRFFQPHCLCVVGREGLPPCHAEPAPAPSAAPVAAPTDVATGAAPPTDTTFEILDISAKVTEANDVYWKYAWKLTIRNGAAERRGFRALIQFKDGEGFVVNESSSDFMILNGSETDSFTGYALVSLPAATNIKRTSVVVKRALR